MNTPGKWHVLPRYGVLRVPGSSFSYNVYDFRNCHWMLEENRVSVGYCLDHARDLNDTWAAHCIATYTNDPVPQPEDNAEATG